MRALAISLALSFCTLAHAAAPVPDPKLSPRDIVELQLAALQHVDEPSHDAGFAIVFRFSSPENRAQTGPLSRFSKMIRESFGEMLNHRSAKLLDTIQRQDQAFQPVELHSLGGERYRYVFILRRQDVDGCKACWFTDGVVPQEDGAPSIEL